jgi:hypothetical protein
VQAALLVTFDEYERRVAALEHEVIELKEQLRRNSQNSSRPPSSDVVPTLNASRPKILQGGKLAANQALPCIGAR